MKSLGMCTAAFFLILSLAGTTDRIGDPLEADGNAINSWQGGTINFNLDACPIHAGRGYALLSTASGTIPGFNLPQGGVNMPVNWDIITELILSMGFPGFMGQLDGTGQSNAQFTLPPFKLTSDVTLSFAYALQGPPWDFASNPVDILIKAPGSTNLDIHGNLLGWIHGGEMCWMHGYDAGSGDTIEDRGAVFG